MEFFANPATSLASLTVASFLAATLLPGGSEAALLAIVFIHPEQAGSALLLATLGNTLGGMTTYALGRWLPHKAFPRRNASLGQAKDALASEHPMQPASAHETGLKGERILGAGDAAAMAAWLERHGAPLLLFAWLPVLGDVLCGAAGWLRLPWAACMFWMALGKGGRYAALLWTAGVG